MTNDDFINLVRSLTSMASENEWIEFKVNNVNPHQIGENIAALSNSAALYKQPNAYIVWGVEDEDHSIVGTTFNPHNKKIKNQELQNWLVTQLKPPIDVNISEGKVDGHHVVIFEIQPATHLPVSFKGTRYIRIGSCTKNLASHPQKEHSLFAYFNETPFEMGIAAAGVSSDDVLSLIDYPEYFQLMDQPLPDNRDAILSKLKAEKIIQAKGADRYDITNIGGILFARSLNDFDRLNRKALRVIIYSGNNRTHTIKEQLGSKGYATGFKGAVDFINDQLPQNEHIEKALRREERMYPEIAIRELVANALIHQDFSITGTGPMVEIFTDRMEISDPGIPLIEPSRFMGEPPRSRNEAIAKLMRRMKICEERGSGIAKVIASVELFQLPAPYFRVAGKNMISILFGPRSFEQMNQEERVRACYQHAELMYVSNRRMSNATLRERLGIKEQSYPLASRIIRDAIDEGFIKPHGSGGNPSYVPFWA